MIKNFFCFILIVLSFTLTAEVVTVTGKGEGKFEVAREKALTEALRDAVRQGAGIDLYTTTTVKNLMLKDDYVFSRSMGYIRTYEIQEHFYDEKTEIYTVIIRADVSKDEISPDDTTAIAMLLRRKKSPVVLIHAVERASIYEPGRVETYKADDMPDKKDIAQNTQKKTISAAVLSEKINDLGIQLLDMDFDSLSFRQDVFSQSSSHDADKAPEKTGRDSLINQYDIEIMINTSGEIFEARHTEDDIDMRDACVSITMKAIWADTHEVISFKNKSLTMTTMNNMPRHLFLRAVKQILDGEDGQAFFRKIFKKWIVELDLGANIKLVFEKADDKQIKQISDCLSNTVGVTPQIRLRNFNSTGYSTLEVESRSDYRVLSDRITEATSGMYTLEQATPHCLIFRLNDKIKVQNINQQDDTAKSTDKNF